MPLTPVQIKDKLANALDDDKNVIDEKAVEEVITLLEASTITKEILEQTRLGRDINLARKTIKNPAIAKRAKNLVKAWKQLIVVPEAHQVANGQHRVSPGLSPAMSKGSRSNTPVTCVSSPALNQTRQQQGLKVASTRSPVVQFRASQPPLPPSKLIQDVKSKANAKVRSPLSNSASQQASARNSMVGVVINEDSNVSWPKTPPSVASENSQDRLTGDPEGHESMAEGKNGQSGEDKRNFKFIGKLSEHSSESTLVSVNRASDQRDVSKTNVANRKKTRSSHFDDLNDFSPDPPKQSRHVSPSRSLSTFSKNNVINGSSVGKINANSQELGVPSWDSDDTKASGNNLHDQPDTSFLPNRINQRLVLPRQESVDSRTSLQSQDSRGMREKLSKVKTTEQLIEDMQRKSATPVATNIIAQIRTNQIQKESDSQKSTLPAGVKRRGRKRRKESELEILDTSGSDGRRLAQTKNEYIERFLQTSVAPTPGEDAFEQPISNSRQESQEDLPLGGCSSTFAQSAYESGFHSYSSRQDKPDSGPSASPPEARDIEGPGHLPAATVVSLQDTSAPDLAKLSEEQILMRLPPIHYDNIDWTSHDYPSPQPIQVSEPLVDRLHHGEIEGLNGTYDRNGQFSRWHEMLTVDSIYDEPLHILPYVIPDD